MITPRSFTYIDGTSGRTHIGFVAQEVQEAMEVCGISTLEFAGFVKDVATNDDGTESVFYGLRYEEFIALLTYAMQDHDRRLTELESKVNALIENN